MDKRDIRDEMAYMAEFDLDLPMSLISDAWDLLHMSGNTSPTLGEWTKALKAAIDAYHRDLKINRKYAHNPMKYSI